MRSLGDMTHPYQRAPEVSIVSTPPAGRLEGGSDRPEFEAIGPKTAPAASHCKTATCRSVTCTCTGKKETSSQRAHEGEQRLVET
jgi:hypothetical protein